ncbi:class F sortase [Amnibacterium endophyticum]|uniref:Class F sortase n=1 Tax=Amnibacterium endophyticum TaxID=2109337 RepID=A0ABW4LCP9_9MICO
MPVRSAALQPPREQVAPVRVAVPSVDVDMRVEPVGVLTSGAMDVPERPSVAGWYRFGPDASSREGTTVLAAHVDSLEWGLGPFVRIRELPRGARVLLTDDRGERVEYRVEGVERTAKADLPVGRLFSRSGDRRLVLITCGGSFDRTTRTYSQNVIVHARPADPPGSAND